MNIWPSGYLDIHTFGLLTIWTSGHVDIWSSRHHVYLAIRSFGHLTNPTSEAASCKSQQEKNNLTRKLILYLKICFLVELCFLIEIFFLILLTFTWSALGYPDIWLSYHPVFWPYLSQKCPDWEIFAYLKGYTNLKFLTSSLVVTIVDDYCIPGGHYKSREK